MALTRTARGETIWPTNRLWMHISDGQNHLLPSGELNAFRCCALLGSAGLGKTFELRKLADEEQNGGRDVRFERLALLGQTPDGLYDRLKAISSSASSNSSIYLDALDEVMASVKVVALVVEKWIREELSKTRPVLRISCRSSLWSADVTAALRATYGDDHSCVAVLQPLSDDDIRGIVQSFGLDAATFLDAVMCHGLYSFATQPLTLQMLVQVYSSGAALPQSRTELFARGVYELCAERQQRIEGGTGPSFTTHQLLDTAERLACLLLLSGRESVDLDGHTSQTCLSCNELAALADGSMLDPVIVRALGQTGLCESNSPRRIGFAHRQFAEYLAGRRLGGLLLHQSRSLLSSGLGWQAGVASPLRETAAFTAMHNQAVAEWIAQADPEVFGLSDVADVQLRRAALLNLLDKYRRHELTDSQIIGASSAEVAGYRYDGVEADLQPVLRERGAGCEDVLECAISLVDRWNLSSMHDELATICLDRAAPLESRRAAGYAIARAGTPCARQRLLPLINAGPDDENLDLKGLALRCNWPDAMSVQQLLTAISSRAREGYGGAYQSFLFTLDRSGFSAEGNTLDGLIWARRFLDRDSDILSQGRIARRIAIASLSHLDNASIATALCELLQSAAQNHCPSPLTLSRMYGESDSETTSGLSINGDVRRRLIDELAARITDDTTWWWLRREVPELVLPEDFRWLVERATEEELPPSQRENYARIAQMIPWWEQADNFETWFHFRAKAPLPKYFPQDTCIALGSVEAEKAKKDYLEQQSWSARTPPTRLEPPPAERVRNLLARCETESHLYFIKLSLELTLQDTSTNYGFARDLIHTPGWRQADRNTRGRIVDAAKRLLVEDSTAPDECRSIPFNSILSGYMAGIWLVMHEDDSWLQSRPTEWWCRWCWYVLRELHPFLSDEESLKDRKTGLLTLLFNNAPAETIKSINDLAALPSPESDRLVSQLLDLLKQVPSELLDAELSRLLSAGTLSPSLVGDIARFLLSRDCISALHGCTAHLSTQSVLGQEERAIEAAVALLEVAAHQCWSTVHTFLHARPDLACRVLAELAHRERFMSIRGQLRSGLSALETGQLVNLLLRAFPPESDPPHESWVTADQSARRMRDRLISYLGDQDTADAVSALRSLEHTFGAKYSWLRRPRARAEAAFRRSCWTPIQPSSVADMLAAVDRHLIRSSRDAIDGIEAAIDRYVRKLAKDNSSEMESLWNRPRKGPVTPKEEEHFSDKICEAIREYYQAFAVTADREVQIYRRKLSAKAGGAAGSEVDVLCRIPARGTVHAVDAIAIPIEVKLSNNPEAKTGLDDQLVDRYIAELGTNCGAYIVGWIGSLPGVFRSVWKSPEEAKTHLVARATDIMRSSGLTLLIEVIDASLPRAKPRAVAKKTKLNKKSKKSPTKQKIPGTKTAPKKKAAATKVSPKKSVKKAKTKAKK